MPAMRPVGRKRDVLLLEALSVTWDGGSIEVPKGFVHDGPSIPNRLRGLIYYTHRLLRPSIVHDWLCVNDIWTQKRRSLFLIEALAVEGTSVIRRRLMWGAVRAGGLGGWG
jgi:hypothetical protein